MDCNDCNVQVFVVVLFCSLKVISRVNREHAETLCADEVGTGRRRRHVDDDEVYLDKTLLTDAINQSLTNLQQVAGLVLSVFAKIRSMIINQLAVNTVSATSVTLSGSELCPLCILERIPIRNSLFDKFSVFTARRNASAVLAVVVCLCVRLSVRLSVCPSVCPSQAGIVSKRLHVGSRKQRHTIAQGI